MLSVQQLKLEQEKPIGCGQKIHFILRYASNALTAQKIFGQCE
jgi:hypothetical protein